MSYTTDQHEQALAYAQRVAALEAENARLRAIVQALVDADAERTLADLYWRVVRDVLPRAKRALLKEGTGR